jgi:hypothetical protein
MRKSYRHEYATYRLSSSKPELAQHALKLMAVAGVRLKKLNNAVQLFGPLLPQVLSNEAAENDQNSA